MVIPSNERKVIINKLYEWKDMPKRLIEIEEELDSCKGDENSYIRSKNKIGRSVENLAIRLAEHKEYNDIKKWRLCIDTCFAKYTGNSLKMKYITRKYVYNDTVYYKKKGYIVKDIEIYKDFELEGITKSEITYKRMKNAIIEDIYKEAKLRKLI